MFVQIQRDSGCGGVHCAFTWKSKYWKRLMYLLNDHYFRLHAPYQFDQISCVPVISPIFPVFFFFVTHSFSWHVRCRWKHSLLPTFFTFKHFYWGHFFRGFTANLFFCTTTFHFLFWSFTKMGLSVGPCCAVVKKGNLIRFLVLII